MKRTLLALVIALACGSIASAQNHAGQQPATPELTPAVITPEMWYYSQEQRRYDDPQQAVRRKAEFVSQQRAARIAAMKWYGMSNSRPVAHTTPSMGVYSPAWTGNGGDRFDWIGLGGARSAGYIAPEILR
jgi:4'-phosphopantetheinyl transferase EntD